MAHEDEVRWYHDEAERLRTRASGFRRDTATALSLFRMASQMDLLADQLLDDENSTSEGEAAEK